MEKLLENMGFAAQVNVMVETEKSADRYFCKIRVDSDQNLLIGQYGANLAALQHLARVILRKCTGTRLNVTVDINEYFKEKKTTLEHEAAEIAEAVMRQQTAQVLRPMLSHERKIIHTFLAQIPGIATESIGQGTTRRVRVKPAPREVLQSS